VQRTVKCTCAWDGDDWSGLVFREGTAWIVSGASDSAYCKGNRHHNRSMLNKHDTRRKISFESEIKFRLTLTPVFKAQA
jgi:hypothetical protein